MCRRLFWGEDTRLKRRRSICPNGATHTSPGCQPWDWIRENRCVLKEHRIGHAGGEVRGRRLCGVPSERGKVLPGGFPGLHPGLVCDAPLGHVRGLQNNGHPQSQVSVNLGHPLLSGLWSKEWVSHMPSMPSPNEWVSHMRSTRMVGGEEIRPLPTPPTHDPRPLLQRRPQKANSFQKLCRPMGLDLESNKWDGADVDREQHRRS